MRSKEDVISIIRSYCLANDGDEATTDLLLAVGAEILGVSAEEMQKRLAWSDRESDVPNQEDGHEQDRFTKRLPDGQAIMDCQKARLIGRLNTANPSNNARHFTVATAARTVLRTTRMRRPSSLSLIRFVPKR